MVLGFVGKGNGRGAVVALAMIAADRELRIMLDESTDPNRRGRVQTRPFTFDGEVLSYRVPRLPDGTVPISEWRRDK
jgi:hypothetical protein